MVLQLTPATAVRWRDRHTVQIGTRPGRRVLLGSLDAADRAVLRALGVPVPHRDPEPPVVPAGCLVGGDDGHPVVRALAVAGLLVDPSRYGPPTAPAEEAERASVAALTASLDGGLDRWTRRRAARVVVHGVGRVGALVARNLDAAGVGRVRTVDDHTAGPLDPLPGGLAVTDVGSSRSGAVRRLLAESAATRASAADRTVDAAVDRTLDLDVVTSAVGSVRDRAAELAVQGRAHLVVEVEVATATIGPLVLPGRTSCLRCRDLHRADRDRTWSRAMPTLDTAGSRRASGVPVDPGPEAEREPAGDRCDVALATATAALVLHQVLAHVEGRATWSTDASVVLDAADMWPRRRRWRAHPACGCRWQGAQ